MCKQVFGRCVAGFVLALGLTGSDTTSRGGESVPQVAQVDAQFNLFSRPRNQGPEYNVLVYFGSFDECSRVAANLERAGQITTILPR